MKNKIIHYDPKLKILARKLRNESTYSEILLWKYLKRKQIYGYDFHRQKPIEKYIVDFFCYKLMLAIEIDGNSHDDEERYKADIIRQKVIENLGIRFLRYSDLEVKSNVEGVVEDIKNWIKENGFLNEK